MAELSREEAIFESMNAPKVIDVDIDIKIPLARSSERFEPEKHKFKCLCCGKGFVTQKKFFQKTNSPLFQSNDGYLTWCKDCTDKYVFELTKLYSGNEEHAIGHFCQQADWVYEYEPLKCARETSGDRSRISHYAAKKNLNVGNRKTYIDSLKHKEKTQPEVIVSKEQVKSEETNITATAIDRWGVGFTELEYKNLDEHYRMLKRNNPNADNNQEIFIKSLCNLNMLMIKALRNGDSDKYVKLTDQYSKTFKQAGLRTIEEKDTSNDECLGVTLATISQYTPEEYYKDKKLYEDFDNIGDYFDRFVKRPLKNLMFGTDERDKEYYVKDIEDGEDLYD